jgi:hypothetical protein
MLLQVGTLTEEQLEQVLSAQSVYGGRIGTNLVEMGLLSEEHLGRLLNEKLGVPCVEPASLEQVPDLVIAILPQEMVQRLQVLPVALEGKRLTLAMKDPSNFGAIDEVGFFTGLVIVPRVCSERLFYLALERYYGIKRVLNYIPVAGGMRTRMAGMTGASPEIIASTVPEADERQIPEIPAGRQSASHGADCSPQPSRAQVPLAEAKSNPGEIHDLNVIARAEHNSDAIAVPSTGGNQPSDLESLGRRFAAAAAEGEVVTILMSYLMGAFERSGLLSLRGGAIVGVQAFSCGLQVANFNGCTMALAEAALIKGMLENRTPYLGKLPEIGIEGKLLATIGGAPGEATLLLPLVMSGVSVAFLLVQDEKGRLASGLFTLQRVVAKAGLAFEMIGIRKKIGLV